MEEKSNFEALLERAEDFTRTNIELIKLKAVDKISDNTSAAVVKIVAIFFFILFFIMISVGLSLWLGEVMGKAWYGFMTVAGFYGILFAVLFFAKHSWLRRIIGNSIIKSMLS